MDEEELKAIQYKLDCALAYMYTYQCQESHINFSHSQVSILKELLQSIIKS